MDPVIEAMGENALLLRLGTDIDSEVNVRVHALCRLLREADLPALEDLVPAYASILVRFEPDALEAGEASLPELGERIRQLMQRTTPGTASDAGAVHRIPVCYGGGFGADMQHVENVTGLSRDRVIELHTATEYRVAMIGFAPGFTYLLGMDERLMVARREQPRTRVPSGSVAIGGAQTGVYPAELPGGWQLIGRTPERLFDAAREERPCRLAPGDRVRFVAIDETTFRRLREEAQA